MCNNYRAPNGVDLARGWHVQIQGDWHWKLDVYPGDTVPIIRRAQGGGRECVMARFGLVPWWSKTEKVGWSTMNARSESAAEKPAFRDAFARRQWCIVPAWEIFEPFYAPGAKRSARWGIEHADGTALGICGLWDRWKSPAGDVVLSFAMLTVNCDEHPLLKRFHKHFDEKGEQNERRTPRCCARRTTTGGSKHPSKRHRSTSTRSAATTCRRMRRRSFHRRAQALPRHVDGQPRRCNASCSELASPQAIRRRL